MGDPLDEEHQRRLRAERILLMLRKLWGQAMPPGPQAEVTLLIDAIAVDDHHAEADHLVSQRDGLTYEVLAALCTRHLLEEGRAAELAARSASVSGPLSTSLPLELLSRLRSLRLLRELTPSHREVDVRLVSPSVGATSSTTWQEDSGGHAAGSTVPLVGAPDANSVQQTIPSVVRPAQVGMWEVAPDTRTIAYDGVTARLMGLGDEPGHSSVARHLDLLVHGDDRERVEQAMDHALETGATYLVRFRVDSPLGVPTWLISHGRMLSKPSDPTARLTGYVALERQA